MNFGLLVRVQLLHLYQHVYSWGHSVLQTHFQLFLILNLFYLEVKEGEVKEGETSEEEEGPKIPDDFYYDYARFASKPVISTGSGLPDNLLTLQHSYGYDCTKRANLHILDVKTVVFSAGNLVQILDVETKEQTFIRSSSGGGIGAITVSSSLL